MEKQEAPVQRYEPPVMFEAGTVTGATLGSNKKEGVDDTEYWH
ncbi:hypothetical protein ABT354_36380 [Streptomyces sp. NPDC000594]